MGGPRAVPFGLEDYDGIPLLCLAAQGGALDIPRAHPTARNAVVAISHETGLDARANTPFLDKNEAKHDV